jgi:hypothetical protein
MEDDDSVSGSKDPDVLDLDDLDIRRERINNIMESLTVSSCDEHLKILIRYKLSLLGAEISNYVQSKIDVFCDLVIKMITTYSMFPVREETTNDYVNVINTTFAVLFEH